MKLKRLSFQTLKAKRTFKFSERKCKQKSKSWSKQGLLRKNPEIKLISLSQLDHLQTQVHHRKESIKGRDQCRKFRNEDNHQAVIVNKN